MKMTATQLRSDLFKTLDYVIETGDSVEIQRKEHTILIAAKKPKSRLQNLISHNVTVGDDEDFVSMDWYKEWHHDIS